MSQSVILEPSAATLLHVNMTRVTNGIFGILGSRMRQSTMAGATHGFVWIPWRLNASHEYAACLELHVDPRSSQHASHEHYTRHIGGGTLCTNMPHVTCVHEHDMCHKCSVWIPGWPRA